MVHHSAHDTQGNELGEDKYILQQSIIQNHTLNSLLTWKQGQPLQKYFKDNSIKSSDLIK